MSATMNCPGCQTLLRVRDDMAGKKIKCPRCAHIVAIPAKAEGTPDKPVVLEEITAEKPRPKPKGEATTRPCPACGERISVAARQCRYCQAVIEDGEDKDDDDEPVQKRSKYKPCPHCGEAGAKRVKWTPWGSFYGPAMFNHVRCPGCGYKYNGRSGRSNLIPAIIFVTIPLVLILALLGFIGWIVYDRVIKPQRSSIPSIHAVASISASCTDRS